MTATKKDPTVSSATGEGRGGLHKAPPIEEADNSATDIKYAENPDKPDPSTVAQVEVKPDDK